MSEAEQRRDVARGIDALRRGWPVTIGTGAERISLLPIETADGGRLANFAPDGRFDVLLSAERAATLMLGNQRAAAEGQAAVRIAQVPWLDLDAATALADPARDLLAPLKGPFRTAPLGDSATGAAAIKLARIAGLLPAFFVRAEGEGLALEASAIADYDSPVHLQIASRARLPVEAKPQNTEIIAFRSANDAVEHVALVIGAPNGTAPLVRLHSECLTGDVFGSLKCDCGPQLDAALHRIAGEGWGILLYLRQEGRGIGLVNKLRAYALQDQGFDTVDANLRLGFAVDARDFGVAARMLSLIGQTRIRLLTNNPAKVEGLRAAGIDVAERVEHSVAANPHNGLPRHQAGSYRSHAVTRLVVETDHGRIHMGDTAYPCTIGKGGAIEAGRKREGDGCTPLGRWPVRAALLRPDRGFTPPEHLPWRWLRPADGWSDDIEDPCYNRSITHPWPFSAERMWRDDDRYDVVIVLGHNDDPPMPGAGSAIFLHLRGPVPTEGCVAIERDAMAALLPHVAAGSILDIRRELGAEASLG